MAAQPQPRLTPEEYLALERAAESRSEYFDGHMYAMSGSSYRHFVITGNLGFGLRSAVGQRGCTVGTSDMPVLVSPRGLYTYPGVIVVCGEPRFADGSADTLLNPIVLIEVLSPSTEGHDRGFQAAQFRMIESLQEYALVSQTEPRVEIFRRQVGGAWLLTEAIGLEQCCRFESIDCTIALKDVYAKVVFGGEDAPAP